MQEHLAFMAKGKSCCFAWLAQSAGMKRRLSALAVGKPADSSAHVFVHDFERLRNRKIAVEIFYGR